MGSLGWENAAESLAAEGGAEEFIENWTLEKRGLLPQLQSFSQQLNSCYQNIIQLDNLTSQAELRRESMKNQVNQVEELKDAISQYIYASSKGGADIMLKREEMYQNLWRIRNDVYNIGNGKENQQLLTKTALSGMKLVYQLRAAILQEPEEKIIITFAEGGYRKETQIMKAMEISMSKFLDYAISASENIIEFNTEAFSKQLYGDPYKLKLRSSSTVLDQLKNIADNSYNLSINQNGNKQNVNRNLYEELIKNRNFLLRSDANYDVIRKGQSGAIAESLVNATINNTDFQYKKDSEVWYKNADVIGSNGQGYSVKNFVGGNPTLLRINSLHTVIDGLIGELSRTDITIKEMYQNISSQIFGVAANGLDANGEAYIEKIIAEGLGI